MLSKIDSRLQMPGMTAGGKGVPETNVGKDLPVQSSPQVVSGDPSGEGQDRFPISDVGHDHDLRRTQDPVHEEDLGI